MMGTYQVNAIVYRPSSSHLHLFVHAFQTKQSAGIVVCDSLQRNHTHFEQKAELWSSPSSAKACAPVNDQQLPAETCWNTD